MTSPQNPSGNLGTKVVFENEHTRVWDLYLEPGEASEWHHHNNWYVIVATTPGSLRVEFADGSSGENTFQVGDVHYLETNSTHRVINTGAAPYCSVITELKQRNKPWR